MELDVPDLFERLAAPFEPSEVEWKPQAVREGRCLAIAYIDARCVMDRLDSVLGPDNWQDDYQLLPEGGAICRLRIRLPGTAEWVLRTDVGSESDQADAGDRKKAAVSDALKRAAVKLGIGRYLYRLPGQWVDYDPRKKQIIYTPRLPAWALPAGWRQGGGDAAESPPPTSGPVGRDTPPHEESETLTREELKAIADAASKDGGTVDGLCKRLGIERLDDLPRWRKEEAYRVIELRKRRVEKARQQAGT
jgi:Rad52/22 family double-strand break repair protein